MSFLRNFGLAAGGAFVGGHVFSYYIASVWKVSGASMMPTFRPDNNGIVLVSALHKHLGLIQKGDIVIATLPLNSDVTICKRIRDSEESTIPDDHVWLEGDNPARSRDSRVYGPVPMALVRGAVVAQIWPWSDAKLLLAPRKQRPLDTT